MKGGVFIIAALLLLAPASLAAQSLHEALAHTLLTNPQTRASWAGVEAARASRQQALAAYFPRIGVSASYGHTDEDVTRLTPADPTTMTPAGSVETEIDRDPLTVGATITQNIFSAGGVVSAARRAARSADAAGQRHQDTLQNIFLAAIAAYFDVLRDHAVLSLNRGNVELISERLVLTRRRAEVGELTRTDVAQAEARLALARAELSAADAAFTAAQAAFERIIGQKPENLVFPLLPELPANIDEARALAENHPALEAARSDLDAARHGVVSALSRFFPTVDVEGAYTYAEEPAAQTEEAISTSVTARITWPFFTGGANWAGLSLARAQREASRFSLQDAHNMIRQSTTNAWTNLATARAQTLFAREQQRASKIALESVQREAEVGARTTLDVLDAAQELLSASVRRAESRRNEHVAAYTLLASAGVLTAERLRLARSGAQ